mmetsp:Transcript_22249/g.59165  ORF Transcript_22249/g.59165 Transcript_22249/m.59165 type:complete len:189 (-) Transcript_22249:1095-1661(-)
MATIQDIQSKRLRKLMESSNWLITHYFLKHSHHGFLEHFKQRNQAKHRAGPLLLDPRLFPLFQPGVKLIESTFFLAEYRHRHHYVRIHEVELDLPIRKRKYIDPMIEMARLLREAREVQAEEVGAFLRYVVYLARDVCGASTDKEGNRMTEEEKRALDTLADAFGVPRLVEEDYEDLPFGSLKPGCFS